MRRKIKERRNKGKRKKLPKAKIGPADQVTSVALERCSHVVLHAHTLSRSVSNRVMPVLLALGRVRVAVPRTKRNQRPNTATQQPQTCCRFFISFFPSVPKFSLFFFLLPISLLPKIFFLGITPLPILFFVSNVTSKKSRKLQHWKLFLKTRKTFIISPAFVEIIGS